GAGAGHRGRSARGSLRKSPAAPAGGLGPAPVTHRAQTDALERHWYCRLPADTMRQLRAFYFGCPTINPCRKQTDCGNGALDKKKTVAQSGSRDPSAHWRGIVATRRGPG